MSSKPMKAKKPSAAPRAMAVQLTSLLAAMVRLMLVSGVSDMKIAPATITISSPVSSTIVAMMLVVEDSRMPRKLIAASKSRMPTTVTEGGSSGMRPLM
jgi:hypothetical protein